MPNPLWTHDRKAAKPCSGVVGVDEAGRGCLAGPVVAGAALLTVGFFANAANRRRCAEVNDSKQLDQAKREKLLAKMETMRDAGELWFATGEASIDEIESENIVGATCLAMRRAMDALADQCDGIWKPKKKEESDNFFSPPSIASERWLILVDGRPMKRLPYDHQGLIKGDTLSLAVAMGSIAAKVTRDRLMIELDARYPGYDFASNKGYGSPNHLKGLAKDGPTEVHRPRFLKKILSEPNTEKSEQSLLNFD